MSWSLEQVSGAYVSDVHRELELAMMRELDGHPDMSYLVADQIRGAVEAAKGFINQIGYPPEGQHIHARLSGHRSADSPESLSLTVWCGEPVGG